MGLVRTGYQDDRLGSLFVFPVSFLDWEGPAGLHCKTDITKPCASTGICRSCVISYVGVHFIMK